MGLENRQVLLEDRPPIKYDVLSINTGSAPQVQQDASTAGVTPVKPIDGFSARWDNILSQVPTWKTEHRFLVVGGGAGGFELAVSMHSRLQKELSRLQSTTRLNMALVTRSGLLPQHSPGVRRLAKKALEDRGIALHTGYDIVHAKDGALLCKKGQTLAYDDCIWCTQGCSQAWIQSSGLALDGNNFLLVDQHMRCKTPSGIDGGTIFAGGDVATIEGHDRPKAGVFAVMAGVALWVNICATLRAEKLVKYWPQRSFLGLLSLGDGTCIASRGSLSMQSEWLWHLKDWIDRRWMWNYEQGLPDMTTITPRVTAVAQAIGPSGLALLQHSTMRCGGCGAKVGATTLSQAMSRVDIPAQPGAESGAKVAIGVGDDAAVVELSAQNGKGSVTSVQTIDFFRSFIGDPYLFGRIAAIHSLSDCEAMGAVAQTALALVQLPYAAEDKQEEDLVQLMSGVSSALREVGCALVGGHTCEARELGFGLSVNGMLKGEASSALTKGALKRGTMLILTKPIGTGTLFAADMRYKARGPWIASALRHMSTSNAPASAILRSHGVEACTDLTGFGLVGHLFEMCKSSGVEAAVDLKKLPLLEGAVDCLDMGITSSLQPANTRLRRSVANHDEVCGERLYPLLFDPQTSGGLLAAIPANRVSECIAQLRQEAAPEAVVIGQIMGPASQGSIELISVRA